MKLEWSLFAQEDREAIFDYLEPRNPRAAITVDQRIESAAELLRRFPLIGRIGRVANTREWVVSRTPYLVIYQPRGGCTPDPSRASRLAPLAMTDARRLDGSP